MNQLERVNKNSVEVESYSYDGVSNRLSDKTHNDWSYNGNNQLISKGNTTYTYDANGALTKKTTAGIDEHYIYDVTGRMVEVRDHSNQVLAQYSFDPFGRRLSKTVGGVTTYYFYTAEGIAGEYSSSGALIKEYGFKPGGTWSTDPLFMRTAGQIYYYHTNHLGQPLKLFDKTGNVVWSAESESFGATAVGVNAVENNLRFPGQYYDAETGLHYNFFRDYDPGLGRYVQSDPLGIFDGPNTYVYVGANPLSYVDPTGEFGVPGAIVGGAFGFVCELAQGKGWDEAAVAGALGALGGGLGFGYGLALDLGYGAYTGSCSRDQAAKAISSSAGEAAGELDRLSKAISELSRRRWASPTNEVRKGMFGGLASCFVSYALKKP